MSLSFSSRADVFIPKPGPQAAATEQDCPPNNPVQAFVKPARVVVHPLDSPEEPSVELRNVLVLMSPRGQPDMIQLSSVAPAKMDILRDTALAIINFGPPVSAEVMVSTTFIELPHGQPALWLTRDLASLALYASALLKPGLLFEHQLNIFVIEATTMRKMHASTIYA